MYYRFHNPLTLQARVLVVLGELGLPSQTILVGRGGVKKVNLLMSANPMVELLVQHFLFCFPGYFTVVVIIYKVSNGQLRDAASIAVYGPNSRTAFQESPAIGDYLVQHKPKANGRVQARELPDPSVALLLIIRPGSYVWTASMRVSRPPSSAT
jgi:hypothetical protein